MERQDVAYATWESKVMQKLADSVDLRVCRTRKLLQQALIEGTVEKGFADLTVRRYYQGALW